MCPNGLSSPSIMHKLKMRKILGENFLFVDFFILNFSSLSVSLGKFWESFRRRFCAIKHQFQLKIKKGKTSIAVWGNEKKGKLIIVSDIEKKMRKKIGVEEKLIQMRKWWEKWDEEKSR